LWKELRLGFEKETNYIPRLMLGDGVNSNYTATWFVSKSI